MSASLTAQDRRSMHVVRPQDECSIPANESYYDEVVSEMILTAMLGFTPNWAVEPLFTE